MERSSRRVTTARATDPTMTAPTERRLARARDSFAPLDRLLPQLHPDKPLERGFARVTDRDGQTLTSREQAERAKALTLRFRDGALPVHTEGAPARKPLESLR